MKTLPINVLVALSAALEALECANPKMPHYQEAVERHETAKRLVAFQLKKHDPRKPIRIKLSEEARAALEEPS